MLEMILLRLTQGDIGGHKVKTTGPSGSPILRDRHQIVISVKAFLENTRHKVHPN